MFAKLFGSGVRYKLLQWFFLSSHPESFLLALTENLQIDIKGCHSELVKLEDLKLITKNKQGRQIIYTTVENNLSTKLRDFLVEVQLNSHFPDSEKVVEFDLENLKISSQKLIQSSYEYAKYIYPSFDLKDYFLLNVTSKLQIYSLKTISKYNLTKLQQLNTNKMSILRLEDEVNTIAYELKKNFSKLTQEPRFLFELVSKNLAFSLILFPITISKSKKFEKLREMRKTAINNLQSLQNLKPLWVDTLQTLETVSSAKNHDS